MLAPRVGRSPTVRQCWCTRAVCRHESPNRAAAASETRANNQPSSWKLHASVADVHTRPRDPRFFPAGWFQRIDVLVRTRTSSSSCAKQQKEPVAFIVQGRHTLRPFAGEPNLARPIPRAAGILLLLLTSASSSSSSSFLFHEHSRALSFRYMPRFRTYIEKDPCY